MMKKGLIGPMPTYCKSIISYRRLDSTVRSIFVEYSMKKENTSVQVSERRQIPKHLVDIHGNTESLLKEAKK